ncbi:MAG: metal ABC transporter ATP-binding protein [Synergistaceae bacterium]|jgi:zinc transport system ATP-binding protein|nr:metal ABC transporter ATP-binding protein [Synergistaceae bacterium]
MAVVSFHDASFAYGGRTVIDGLSLDVDEGECLCIVGENGAGKSTLMKGMLGLITPSGGSVKTTSGAGYLPQGDGGWKRFPASVSEVVISGCLARHGFFSPFYSKADKSEAEEHMERLGVASLRDRPFLSLSLGQERRVLLARALCAARTLLALDEPTAGLDQDAARTFYEIARRANRSGMAVVLVSHDPDAAAILSARVLNMGDAKTPRDKNA